MHPVEVFRQNGERVNPNPALLEHHSQTKQPHSSIFIDIDTFSQGASDFGQQFNRNISIDVVLVEDNELKPWEFSPHSDMFDPQLCEESRIHQFAWDKAPYLFGKSLPFVIDGWVRINFNSEETWMWLPLKEIGVNEAI